jgi:hypothetical protein
MPQIFLEHRFCALQQRDFVALYHSYHPTAPFLQNFSGEEEYREFARQQLTSIEVKRWRCLKQRKNHGGVECLIAMELESEGQTLPFYELALLLKVSSGWGYHSAQKLAPEACPQDPALLDFSHFDQAEEPIRF